MLLSRALGRCDLFLAEKRLNKGATQRFTTEEERRNNCNSGAAVSRWNLLLAEAFLENFFR